MNDVYISRIEKIFFSVISFIFHPIFIPTFLLIIVFNFFSNFYVFDIKYLIAITSATFILTAIIPIIIISLLYYFKFIKSFYLKSDKERITVSILMTFFYYFTYYFMQKVYMHPQIFLSFILLPIIGTLFSLILLVYSKISMHTFAIGSLLGVILFYKFNFMPFFGFCAITSILMASGLVITARLILFAHKFSEVLIGYFLGIIGGLGLAFLSSHFFI
ncbi:MAG: hypothetical protein ACUVQP_05105 [Bacteroidales bacterium]